LCAVTRSRHVPAKAQRRGCQPGCAACAACAAVSFASTSKKGT
jgi:hypothetical protein